MMTEQIQDLYQNNEDFKKYCNHWAAKENKTPEEVAQYEISRLYAEQLLEKEETKNEEIKYEIHQDNDIS